jgi:hypothetical protein
VDSQEQEGSSAAEGSSASSTVASGTHEQPDHSPLTRKIENKPVVTKTSSFGNSITSSELLQNLCFSGTSCRLFSIYAERLNLSLFFVVKEVDEEKERRVVERFIKPFVKMGKSGRLELKKSKF